VRISRRAVSLAAALTLGVPGCSGKTPQVAAAPPQSVAPADLAGVTLQRSEGPGETVPVRVGDLELDELWPSDCCVALQEAFSDAGFVAAAGALFERPGHSGDPIDTRPGYEVVSSEVASFVTDGGASDAMASWVDYHRAPELDPLPAQGLGADALAFVGMPNAPAETVVLFFWRIGRLVLHLRATGGSILVTEVRALADRMDARAS
jgi:hypothetical protein